MTKKTIKKTGFYRELRYVYRSVVLYRHPFSYLYHRFIVGRKIRRLGRPVDRKPESDQYSIHLLCNHSGMDLLLWSLASWYKNIDISGQVYLHEDGSFTQSDRQIARRLLPHAKIIDRVWAAGQISMWLRNYPALHAFRKNEERYIFALKLTDPFFVSSSPARLVLDIDILWFEAPRQLMELLLVKKTPFMIEGVLPMEYRFADGAVLPPRLQTANGGIIGYQANDFPIGRLEEFMRRSGENNPSRLIDQAGYVYVLGQADQFTPHHNAAGNTSVPRVQAHGAGFTFLNNELYTIKPKPGIVAGHYTGPKRERFWFEGVKMLKNRILNGK